MKNFILSLVVLFSLATLVSAGPLQKIKDLTAKPTVTVTASAESVTTGTPVILTWKSTGAKKAVFASATVSGVTATEKVELNGTKTVTPTESTLYRIYVSKGFKRTYGQIGVEVKVEVKK